MCGYYIVLFTLHQMDLLNRAFSSRDHEGPSRVMERAREVMPSRVLKTDQSVQVKWQQMSKSVQTTAVAEEEESEVCCHVICLR